MMWWSWQQKKDGKGCVKAMGRGVSKTSFKASAPYREALVQEKRKREELEVYVRVIKERLDWETKAHKIIEDKLAMYAPNTSGLGNNTQSGNEERNYVGRIVEFFRSVDDRALCTAQWFYRADDTIIGETHANLISKKHVFISDVKTDNPLDCILSRLEIAQLFPKIDPKALDASLAKLDYVYNMKYSLEYTTFSNVPLRLHMRLPIWTINAHRENIQSREKLGVECALIFINYYINLHSGMGPHSIGIDAVYMQTYIGGVSCPYICGKHLDHGVLLVGYGAGAYSPIRLKEKPFWIIKNSRGEHWGEKGYNKICKDRIICGVDSMVSTVIAIHC